MKSRQSLGEIRLLASEICFASEIFANAKVIGNNISNKGDQWSPFFVGVVCFKRENNVLPYNECEF